MREKISGEPQRPIEVARALVEVGEQEPAERATGDRDAGRD